MVVLPLKIKDFATFLVLFLLFVSAVADKNSDWCQARHLAAPFADLQPESSYECQPISSNLAYNPVEYVQKYKCKICLQKENPCYSLIYREHTSDGAPGFYYHEFCFGQETGDAFCLTYLNTAGRLSLELEGYYCNHEACSYIETGGGPVLDEAGPRRYSCWEDTTEGQEDDKVMVFNECDPSENKFEGPFSRFARVVQQGIGYFSGKELDYSPSDCTTEIDTDLGGSSKNEDEDNMGNGAADSNDKNKANDLSQPSASADVLTVSIGFMLLFCVMQI